MPNNGNLPVTGAILRASAWTVFRRVIGALLLRELLTRYGRNNIGFLWLFVEPMLFVGGIALIWSWLRIAPGGIPIVAFALTGYGSVILWRNMPGRCIGALQANLSLLYHRQVTVTDIYIARVLLETIAVTGACVGLAIALWAMGWMPGPEDALQVLGGWLLLTWFAIALGWTFGGLAERFTIIGPLWPPASYVLMILSGTFFIAESLPEDFREVLLWVPMLNALEYIREGWFGSLFQAYYDVPYVVSLNLLLTLIGLILVRQAGTDLTTK